MAFAPFGSAALHRTPAGVAGSGHWSRGLMLTAFVVLSNNVVVGAADAA